MNNTIEKIRLNLGLSRKDFAEQLGVTTGAISNYEYGTRNPKPLIGYRILDMAASNGLKLNLEDIYPRKSN